MITSTTFVINNAHVTNIEMDDFHMVKQVYIHSNPFKKIGLHNIYYRTLLTDVELLLKAAIYRWFFHNCVLKLALS